MRSQKIERTTRRRDASILRFAPWQVCFANIAPALRMLPYMQCISVTTYFPSADRTAPVYTYPPPVATFLPSANRITNLTAFPWQSIFIPAQGSPYTTKTVGGEAVRRFFSLKYAVLLYTLSALFTDPPLRKQNTSGKFLRSFFQKATSRPRIPRVPASSHPRIPPAFSKGGGEVRGGGGLCG